MPFTVKRPGSYQGNDPNESVKQTHKAQYLSPATEHDLDEHGQELSRQYRQWSYDYEIDKLNKEDTEYRPRKK